MAFETPEAINERVEWLLANLEDGHAIVCPGQCQMCDPVNRAKDVACFLISHGSADTFSSAYYVGLIKFRKVFWDAAKLLPDYVEMPPSNYIQTQKILNTYKYAIHQNLNVFDVGVRDLHTAALLVAD